MGKFRAALVLTVLAISIRLPAQDFRGQVQGLVTDSSQAAIVNATVTLRNINTGVASVKETQ